MGVSLEELRGMSKTFVGLDQLLDAVPSTMKPSPVVVFTGAGASKPLDMPTMLDFKNNFAGVLTKDKRELWQRILQSSAKHFKNNTDDIDIEYVLTYIECCENSYSMSSLLWEQIYGQQFGTPTIEEIHQFRQALWSIRNNILDEICAVYVSPEPSKAIACFAPLFEMLNRTSGQRYTNVFTTNYDLTFEVLAEAKPKDFELVDGFINDVFCNTYVPQYNSEHSIVLWKLHGSTSWVGNLPNPSFSKVSPGKYIRSDARTIIIYPTKNKAESQNLSTSPFTQAYGGLNSLLCQIGTVEVLLVVGYAFGDQEVVKVFKEGLALNPNAKLIVVDPAATIEKLITIFPNVHPSRLRVISRRFCEQSTIESIEAELLALLPRPPRGASNARQPGQLTPNYDVL